MKINRSERNRAFVLFIFFSLWFLFILFTLFRTQVLDYNKYVSRVKAQSNRIFSLHPKRGTIYDCHGNVLAISIKTKSAFLNNKNTQDSTEMFRQIKKKLRIERAQVKNIMARIERGEKFIWVKRKLLDKEYHILEKFKNSPKNRSILGFIDEYKRIYPERGLAAHVLGGVGIDEQGLSGIEYGWDSVIKGKGGKVKVMLDARKRIFQINYLKVPVSGKDVYLTIDSTIQFLIEKELKNAVKRNKAKGGTVIIMNSENGDILAMGSYPSFFPEKISRTAYKLVKNKAISLLYDPGSTFKIILASAALENEVCYPQQIFNCYNGVFHIKDQTIDDDRPFNKLTFSGIIVHSSNIGAARIGLRLGKKKFYRAIKKFGFGGKTGIQLPAEEKGILNTLKDWSDVSVAFLSFGYEIAVTPVQMVQAFNVIASKGYLIKPNILKNIAGKDFKNKYKQQIISPATRNKIASIMADVVKMGTGKKAEIEGLDIAGKTGTAKKIINGTYGDTFYASFVGFFPAQKPRVTIFVLIEEPKTGFSGGDVAAPLFKSIAEKIMVYLNIFPVLDSGNEIRI